MSLRLFTFFLIFFHPCFVIFTAPTHPLFVRNTHGFVGFIVSVWSYVIFCRLVLWFPVCFIVPVVPCVCVEV